MMKKFKIALLVCFALYFMACDKYPDYCNGGMKYEFDMPVRVSPTTDTIQLGDTLWVEMRIGHPTLNKLNGKRYDITKADLFMYFAIQDLLLPTVIPTSEYIILNENGEPLSAVGGPDEEFGPKVRFKVDGDSAYWKLGFIMAKKGLFMLSFTDDIGKSKQPHITECPYEEVAFKYSFNGGNTAEENNYYFLQYSPDENVGNWSSEQFRQSQYYAFCVD